MYDSSISLDDINVEDSSHQLFEVIPGSNLEDLSELFNLLMQDKSTIEQVKYDDSLDDFKNRYDGFIRKIESSRTAKLWLQYLEMVEILCTFIKAE